MNDEILTKGEAILTLMENARKELKATVEQIPTRKTEHCDMTLINEKFVALRYSIQQMEHLLNLNTAVTQALMNAHIEVLKEQKGKTNKNDTERTRETETTLSG